MTKRHLTRIEIVKLSQLLEANLERMEGGVVRYTGDGALIKPSSPTTDNTVLMARLEAAEKALATERDQRLLLEKRHRYLWSQYDRLCDALSLNRVLDVRSLKYKPDQSEPPAPANGKTASLSR